MTNRMMDPLILRLLGSPEAIYQGRPLKFRSRKVLALLIYLVVERGWHSREKLMALLWPESDRKRSAVSLRSTAARLRRTLAVAGDFLMAESGSLTIDFERPLDLDLHRVETAAQPEASIEALQAALAVARGEFLEGFSLPDAPEFDDWVTVQREAWHRSLETVFDCLSQQHLEQGEHAQAVETAAQWVAWASLSESAYRRLMAAYFLAGDRTAALVAFEKARRVLSQELGVEAAPETVALAERIRTGSPLRPLPEVTAQPSPLVELPLVGRGDEHSQLASLYQQVNRGTTQVAVVIGEAGMGKTRLARAFARWASLERPGADVLQGRAFEVGGRLPYQPLVEALRVRLEAENAPEDLLADVWLAELSQLLPELRDRYPDLPPAMRGEPDFVRSRIFEAVARLVEALAIRRAVVLFVDDLQWADEGTLDMLLYLSRRWAQAQTPVLLLLTVRQEDLTIAVSLRDWLDNLGRDVSLTRLHLPALTPAAVQQLAGILANQRNGEELAQQAVVSEFGAWLQAETGGVPFFVEAMLQMLIEQGVLTRREGEDQPYFDIVAAWQKVQGEEGVPVPPGVREVILNRLGHLSDPARALLLAAAAIGRTCSFERLCQVSGVAELEGLTALEELLNSRLMLEIDDELRPYSFNHDHIRQVVYTEAGEARRRIYHRRAFSALEGADAPAAELAFQAVAARLNEPAFRNSLAAGDEAMVTYASAEALAHYNQALTLAKQETLAVTSGQWIHLYSRRGRAYELLNQFDEALQNYQEMAKQAAERGDEALKLASLSARCIVHATQTPLYNPSEAREQAGQALALARELEDRAIEARVLWGLSLLGAWAGQDYSQALANGQQSLAIAHELGLKEQMAFTQTSLASLYANLDQMEAALIAILEARTVWWEVGNMPMLADAYNLAAWIHMFIGDHEAVLSSAREGISISQSIGNAWNLAGFHVAVGKVLLEQGDIGGAIGNVKKGLKVAKEGGIPVSSFGAYNYLILAYLVAGAVDQAERLAAELYAIRDTIVFNFRILALGYMAQVKVAGGEMAAAQRIVEQALEGLDIEKQAIYLFAPVLLAEAQLQLALGQPGDALARLEYLTGRARRAGVRSYLPETLCLHGKALLALEQVELARQSLLEGQQVAAETGARRVWWPILWELSQLEAAVGNIEAAQEYHKQAREIVTYMADHAGSDELSASFLAQSEIRAIMNPS